MQELTLFQKPWFWLTVFTVLLFGVFFRWPTNQLKVVFCNVGQGDASLLILGSQQILIDGGPANGGVLDCLGKHLPFWDRTIEMVILSHPQSDHFGGLVDVIDRYDVEYFVINPLINNSSSFWRFHQAVVAEKGRLYFPKAGDEIRIGKTRLAFLWPIEKLGEEKAWLAASEPKEKGRYLASVNETSLVFRLEQNRFCVFFTGDIPANVETEIDTLAQCDVLKVAHHGSKYSTSEEFLEKLKPKLAVISVGKNSFGHPSPEVIERLSNLAIKYLRTDKNGEIEVLTGGKQWAVKQ